jgi:hypothetical protein
MIEQDAECRQEVLALLLDLHSHLTSDDDYPERHFNKTGNEIVVRKMKEFLRGTPSLLTAVGMD